MDKNREHELLSMYTFGSIGLPNFNQNLEKKQWCQDLQMAHPEQHWASLFWRVGTSHSIPGFSLRF